MNREGIEKIIDSELDFFTWDSSFIISRSLTLI